MSDEKTIQVTTSHGLYHVYKVVSIYYDSTSLFLYGKNPEYAAADPFWKRKPENVKIAQFQKWVSWVEKQS